MSGRVSHRSAASSVSLNTDVADYEDVEFNGDELETQRAKLVDT